MPIMLFADNSFLFFPVDERETQTLKDILNIYAPTSDQMITIQKSEIYFNRM